MDTTRRGAGINNHRAARGPQRSLLVRVCPLWLPRSAGGALCGDEGDEDVVDDLAQDVVGDRLERHHHFVAEQVEGEVDNPGGEPGWVDLPALDGAVDDLFDSRAALAQERVA